MTDTTEQKALALVNEVRTEYPLVSSEVASNLALCRAIEQHEAFRQEVSDALKGQFIGGIPDKVARFIIAEPVDPLVEALDEALWEVSNVKLTDLELRAVSLRLNAKRGDKIVWGEG